MTRKICVVTGTRAEYGLLRLLLQEIENEPSLELQLIVTGTHLSPEHGLTLREINAGKIKVTETVDILLSSASPVGVSKAIGLGIIGFSESFNRLSPDIVLLVGDRFEILAAATAALVQNIPIAHLHGGETTHGAIDESIRHAVTKFAHLHFVAVEPYRRRVIQLGEQPENVFVVGGLGVDAIANADLLSKKELEASLGFDLGERHLLVTFHPVTSGGQDSNAQLQALLDALDTVDPETRVIFTLPNADAGSASVSATIRAYSAARPHVKLFDSLGQLRYLSCLKLAKGIVGNSSSGLAEAPSFKVGTVNIGDRQAGRLRAESVLDCAANTRSITEALHKLLSDSFQKGLESVENPNGNPGASRMVAKILSNYPIAKLKQKIFHDVLF